MFLTDTGANLTCLQFFEQFLLAVLTFFFDQRAAADHDVAALLVDLQNFTLHNAANEVGDIRWTSHIDLAGRQEDRHPNIDEQASLDFSRASTGNDVVLFDVLDNTFPVQDGIRFPLAERNQPVWIIRRACFVFQIFNQNFDDIANFRRWQVIFPFISWDGFLHS